MFNFFKRKGGKADAAPGTAEGGRKRTSSDATNSPPAPVAICAPRNDSDVTNDKTNTLRKDVVNLLLPDTNYNQKTGVGAFLDIMAGKRRKNKKRTDRTESCRVSPQKEMQHINLQRSKSDLEPRQDARDVAAPTADENTQDAAHAADDPADFVKALVLQKYANKPPTEKPQQHVSLVYVSNEPDLEEKRHAEALLREIARSIDCTIEQINVNKAQMGTTDSKPIDKDKPRREPVYETIDSSNNNSIDSYKSELKDELRKLLKHDNDETKTESQLNKGDETITDSTESLAFKRKSNLKLPKSDTEGCSDDDRSDCGKKRVTFRKHIVFDDGEQQTDEEVNSSFETISSEEDEEEEYLEDTLPDNDELLGGVVVSRNENDNKTVINVNQTESDSANEPLTIKIECSEDADGLKLISSDNSDSGFLEFSDKNESSEDFNSEVKSSVEVSSESEVSGSESESEIEEEVEEKIIEEIDEIKEDDVVEPAVSECDDHKKSLVSQESRFQSQVAALTELADSRCGEAERTRGLIAACRREIEDKEREIQRLKCELEAAYKESELVRQRSRSLEEELSAARSCSADLADQLQRRNDASLRQLRGELEDALTRRAELESRVLALERDRDRLEQEKALQEQRAKEALTAAEATTAKWRSAHEAARSQAAARAERMLADCEWKMRELERKARDADKLNKELTQTVEQLKSAPPPASHIAELQQLRGLATEQQRSIQALTLQLQRVETREEALKLEVHRLKELLEKAAVEAKEKEERHSQAVSHLEQQHSQALERLKAEHQSAAAAARAASERAQAERTRAALAQLRAEAERDARNADRKLREVTTRYENLKEELASKQTEFQTAIAEAHSKADWDVMQLRHLLDRADISYANNMERMAEKHQEEKEQIIKEWTEKLSEVEERAATAASEAQKLLETTRMKLIAERNEQVNKLKEQHRKEMDEQWENFMTDKENCLARMKAECRQEGEEERVKREKDLLEEIAELRAEVQTKSVDFDTLATKAAACGRTLAVTEQELREALAREKELREKRAEDATKIKLVERASREQVEHLTRKCACVRKLFDDMRARLAARERDAEQESRCKEKELHQLRAEVARLTKLLVENSSPALGARTRADGCETALSRGEEPAAPAEPAPRRKGGTLKTPEAMRKRLNLPELQPLPPEARRTSFDEQNGRRRAKSVDLPAVQVPVRIKQLEQKTKE